MRGKPRTADCTIFAVCLMVKREMVVDWGGRVVRRGRKEERGGGRLGVYVSSVWVEAVGDEWSRKYAWSSEVGCARNGLTFGCGGASAGRVPATAHRRNWKGKV